nr:type IV secretion system protein [Novosphingobium umbonatum]
MVLAVAGVGYRLALGHRLGLDGALGLVLRLGLVLALTTQWAAWEAVVYRMALEAPQDWALALMGEQAGGLVQRLDNLSSALSAWSAEGQAALPQDLREALRSTQEVMLAGALGALVAQRLVLGVLLGLGPVFAAGLLFAGTRGLVLGWLRAMLAGAVLPCVLVVELGVVEPLVAGLNTIDPAVAGAQVPMLQACVWGFGLALLLVAGGVGLAAMALRWPDSAHAPVPQIEAPAPQAPALSEHRIDRLVQAFTRSERAAVHGSRLAVLRRTDAAPHVLPLGQQARLMAPEPVLSASPPAASQTRQSRRSALAQHRDRKA